MSVRRRTSIAWALATLATTAGAHAFDPSHVQHAYVARTYQTTDGLPVGVILAAVQTRDGYLWLATEEGLVRFDGVRFVTFNRASTPAFVSNYVRSLAEDAHGTLYVGTFGGGLVRLKNGVFSIVATAKDLGANQIRHLEVDDAGAVWINTEDGGLARLEGDDTPRVTRVDTPAHKAWSLGKGRDGSMWVARDGFGLTHYAAATATGDRIAQTYTTRDGLSSDGLSAVHSDRDGTLWIGTKDGVLNRFKDGVFTAYAPPDAATARIVHLTSDHEGNIWLATQDGGAKRFRDGHFTTFGTSDGLPVMKTYTVLEDREENLWVGTIKGLVRMKRGAFTTYDDAKPGEPSTMIWGVREDIDDGIWITTDSHGVQKHTSHGVTTFDATNGLASDEATVVEQEKSGVVWVGSTKGLSRIEGGKIRVLGKHEGLPDASVYALQIDRKGGLWVGTNGGGVVRYIDGKLVPLVGVDHEAAPALHVITFLEDHTGRMWVGAQEGLSVVDDGVLKRVPLAVEDGVEAIYEDADHTLWIAFANEGLGRLRGDALVHVTARDGLVSDGLDAILEDGHGNLWVSSNSGVTRVAKSDVDAFATKARSRVRAFGYGKQDGMKNQECNGGQTQSAWKTRDGRLWFPTTEGVAVVDPDHLPHNTRPPPVIVEDVRVNREPVNPVAMATASSGDAIVLPAGSREFEFRYTAPSFTTPEAVTFKYMLEGFDQGWVEADGRRVAYYTNLGPGEYRFRVSAANEDGVETVAGAQVRFTLTPHVYETRAFYVGVFFTVVAASYFAFRLRVRQLRARASELEARVKERTAELTRAHADLAEKDLRLDQDLAQAQAFQQRILPTLPTGGPLAFAVAYEPAERVGGDIYDICELASETPGTSRAFRVFLADTTGHGVQASLRTMVLKTEYDRRKLEATSPAQLLAAVNTSLVTTFPGLEMRCSAACFDIRVEPSGAATLVYANAAHPPLLHASKGELHEIYVRSPFLGMMEGVEIDEVTVPLAAGDVVVAYTDGVTEQERDGGEAFGTPRLEAIVKGGGTASDIVARTLAALRDHAGSAHADDVTLVAVSCTA